MSLTKEEADNVVKSLMSTISDGMSESMLGRAALRVSDIADRFPAIKREGSTPDTYCKIAEAILSRGIATDLRTDREGNMILSFRIAESDERKPSPEICSARWKMIESGQFEEHEIDNLSQKDAEKILKMTIEKPEAEFIKAIGIDFVVHTSDEIHFLQRADEGEIIPSTIASGIDSLSIYATESTPFESSIHIADIIKGATIRILSEFIIFKIEGKVFKLFIPIEKG